MFEYVFNITQKLIIFIKIPTIILNNKNDNPKIKLQQDVIKI